MMNVLPTFAIERKMSTADAWRAVAEHNIMDPNAVIDSEHQHQLSLADVRSISAIWCPHLDFSESSITTEEMEMAILAIKSRQSLLLNRPLDASQGANYAPSALGNNGAPVSTNSLTTSMT